MSRPRRLGLLAAAGAVTVAALTWAVGLALVAPDRLWSPGLAAGLRWVAAPDASATPVVRRTAPPIAARPTEPPGVPTRPVAADAPGRGTGRPTPTLAPAVDWPQLPDVRARAPVVASEHFRVYADDPTDPLLAGLARTWAPRLEDILAFTSRRLGRTLPRVPVNVVFARAYAAPCPARGLAAPGEETPLLMVYANEATPTVQLRAVLAHEIVHHLTADARFVGDGILTEGIAHWGAGWMLLDWQGLASWADGVRRYRAEGGYVSIADATALNPRTGDDCIERRDRVYNIRTAFVDWLIRRYGLATVLAMPYRERTVVDPATGASSVLKDPDYEAATGNTLPELERLWLAELEEGAGTDG